jgi:peptidoglycan/LPS O-acetylase OafA/YrhL
MNGRLGQIDGLRFFAALGVLIFHAAGEAGIPKSVIPSVNIGVATLHNVPSVFSLGATGVSLFFVLSGYCLVRSRFVVEGRVREYFRARFFRIYPTYFISVIVSAIVFALIGRLNFVDVFVKLTFLHGFIQSYSLTLNGALWSMATEVQFYILLPLLMVVYRKIGGKWFLASAIVVCVVFRIACQSIYALDDPIVGGTTRSAFLMSALPGRMAEFAIGMFLADREKYLVPFSRAWMLIFLAVGFAVKAAGPQWLAEPLMGGGYGVVLAVALGHWRLSDAHWIAAGGRASYALFLFHYPVLALVEGWIRPLGLDMWGNFALTTALTLAIALPLSALVYSCVEYPIYRRFGLGAKAKDSAAIAAGSTLESQAAP